MNELETKTKGTIRIETYRAVLDKLHSPFKACAWFETKIPALGFKTPDQIIDSGRGEELYALIDKLNEDTIVGEIRNAVIKSTMLGYEDRGILTSMIHLDMGDFEQGFGGYALKDKSLDVFIRRVLRVVGVDTWDQLIGKPCRVEADWSKVYRIGNYLADEWFDPAKEFESL